MSKTEIKHPVTKNQQPLNYLYPSELAIISHHCQKIIKQVFLSDTWIRTYKEKISSEGEKFLFKAPSPVKLTDKTHRYLYLPLTLCFSRPWCPSFSENSPQLQNIVFSSLTTTLILEKPWTQPFEKAATSCSSWPRVSHLPTPIIGAAITLSFPYQNKNKNKKTWKVQPNRSSGPTSLLMSGPSLLDTE